MGTTAGPLTPPSYVAGTITLTGGTAVTLFSLVLAQLEPATPGGVAQFQIYADKGNSSTNSVKVGTPQRQASGGLTPLDDTHFGYELVPGASRTYGPLLTSSTPLASIFLFCTSTVTLHLEIFP